MFIHLYTGGHTPGLLVDRWYGINNGLTIQDLTSLPAYPFSPDARAILNVTVFPTPVSLTTTYGEKVYGFFIPPLTGDYVFWIAADDAGELYLSNGTNPAFAVSIASCPTAVSYAPGNPYMWLQMPSQRSQPISLQAGGRYYFQALMKQGPGNSLLNVAVQLPNGTQYFPMPINPFFVLPGMQSHLSDDISM
jgi:hypothetical protein